MKATYGWSISSAPAIWCFYVPAGFICYIVACLRCLWATAELQDSWLRGPSFQMGNFCFLPSTDGIAPTLFHTDVCAHVINAAVSCAFPPLSTSTNRNSIQLSTHTCTSLMVLTTLRVVIIRIILICVYGRRSTNSNTYSRT